MKMVVCAPLKPSFQIEVITLASQEQNQLRVTDVSGCAAQVDNRCEEFTSDLPAEIRSCKAMKFEYSQMCRKK